ncbi:hypothetical protein NQ318_009811 [Aromia moschata]|uniref:Uncharacterized protein n=1 Tax=Aromia moschata TaxID=1265417 RepID=A0AAV8XMK6_9CUCU|nr:hypothetical protein NQ318_009811 [Aromia moschata]
MFVCHTEEREVYRIGGLVSDCPPHNSREAYKGARRLFEEGIVGLFGPSSTHSSPYIQQVCDMREIPHIETHQNLNQERNDTLVNVYPHPRILSDIFVDLIEAYGWDKVIVLYDNDESLMSVSSLLKLNVPEKRKVILRQLEGPNDMSSQGSDQNYRPVLTEIKLTGETRFVLACSVEILKEVLIQLQQVGMMTNRYSYIITNLDMQTVEMSPFQYAGTNITGISMIDPDTIEVRKVAAELQRKKTNSDGFENDGSIAAWRLKLETALIVDSIRLFAETIYELIDNEEIKAKPLNFTSKDSWKSILGLTGMVKFDREGFRKDFNVDIMELTPWRTIESWEMEFFIKKSPPYGMLTETTDQLTGNDRYEGYCVDVIKELSKILGFNYTFIVQEDKVNGNLDKVTNEWNGMIREIIDGRADLAIADLTVTSEREKAVDFTMPFMNLGISILYRKPEPVPPSLFMFASPFSLLVWVMLGVSYFLVSLSFFIMGRLSPAEWQNPYPCVEEPEHLVNQFSVRNSLWFTIGALMQQGSELAPVAISTRTASGVWWFFVLIMVSSYTANLAAFLTVETLVTPFKNIKELASQTEISYGAKQGGATASYFRDSNVSEYKKVWKYMARHPELMTTDDDESVQKVKTENYAFLMESTTIEYVTERHCTLAQVGGLLDDKGYGIAMKKDSPYRNGLSRAVLKLQETGKLTELKIKWWKEKKGGGKCASKSEGGEATALDLANVGGVFLVLSVGSILGLIASLIELALRISHNARKDHLSFRDEFRKEMRFAVAFKQNVKVIKAGNSDPNDNQVMDPPNYGFKV